MKMKCTFFLSNAPSGVIFCLRKGQKYIPSEALPSPAQPSPTCSIVVLRSQLNIIAMITQIMRQVGAEKQQKLSQPLSQPGNG